MANSSLEQLHQISQQNLEKIHFKVAQTSAVLHLFAPWVERFLTDPAEVKDVGIMQNVIWLLTDLMEETEILLPQAWSINPTSWWDFFV